MFEIYNAEKKINEKRYIEMHNILKKDFINRHGLEKYKKYSNSFEGEGFKRWVTMLQNTENYHIVLYVLDDEIAGFVCFLYMDNKLCLSEVQIKESFQGKGILKKLLRKTLEISNKDRYNKICATIDNDNYKSQNVFKHIGMKNTQGKWYEITYDEFMKWINKY